MTSEVAGFSVSNVCTDLAGPCVQVVVAIALTVVKSSNSGHRMPSKSPGQARKIPLGSYSSAAIGNRSRPMTGTGPDGGPADTGGVPGDAGADLRWLAGAIELSRHCPPARDRLLRRRDPGCRGRRCHRDRLLPSAGSARPRRGGRADQRRDARRQAGPAPRAGASWPASAAPRLAGATLYSSLEPCAARASRPRTCAELIISAGVRRVVIAWLEPPVFVAGGGTARLRAAGVSVIEIPGLARAARAVNAHLLEDRR